MPFTQTPIPGRKLQNVLPAGTALILEGGGLRGYYSAGVMEAFLEKDMLFPYIIGVSAGAANALSYISGQAMRSRQIIEHYVGNPEYVSRRNLLRKGSMFGFDYIFQTIPEQHIRFDWDAYNAQETRFLTGAMNCADGKTVWFEKDEITPPFSATVASCSVPILTKVQHFKGYDLLDGGTSDPIPIEKSIADGNRFHVVVLQIGDVAFGFMLPVLAGYIAMAIGDRPALAVGFVGGMLASQGQSGFLGALAAGFIAGYLVVLLRKVCDKLPQAIEKIAPVLIYPVVGILVMGLIMNFIIEPVMGGINTALNNGLMSMGGSSKLVLGLLLGGMMAVDMGGPFNKAAYVFGTAAIASGNYDVMAAVMLGGMTPPCAIALATLLFQNKFTEEERKNGPMNFIMGLAFITEGAIPYAASDPLHVLPACIAGSAAAGALSMVFGCTLMAPHGGIFVFPVVGNAVLYLAALAAGTLISTALLGVLKKKAE